MAVVCKKEIYGFIVNRLSWAALDAAKECVRDGVCSVEDMDKAIMFGPGMRMAVTGQLLTISLGVEGGFRAIADKYGSSIAICHARPHTVNAWEQVIDEVKASGLKLVPVTEVLH